LLSSKEETLVTQEQKDLEEEPELVTVEDNIPTNTDNKSRGWFW